jgi:hypothetical protein
METASTITTTAVSTFQTSHVTTYVTTQVSTATTTQVLTTSYAIPNTLTGEFDPSSFWRLNIRMQQFHELHRHEQSPASYMMHHAQPCYMGADLESLARTEAERFRASLAAGTACTFRLRSLAYLRCLVALSACRGAEPKCLGTWTWQGPKREAEYKQLFQISEAWSAQLSSGPTRKRLKISL